LRRTCARPLGYNVTVTRGGGTTKFSDPLDDDAPTTARRVVEDDAVTMAMHSAGSSSASVQSGSNWAVGREMGRYVVLGHIGAGGLGDVLSAYDPQLDRRIALKVLRNPDGELGLGDPTQRLLREAQAVAQLRHLNVVTVHDVGTHDGQVFMAMEFVQGTTLSRWFRESQRSWSEIRDVMLQAGEGLSAAHAAGLVHRDFKPANVIVTPQRRAVVLDFGLSKALEPGSRESLDPALRRQHSLLDEEMTEAGLLLGTPQYMAWELFSNQPGTAASDQFAYCVTFYQALYGFRPFAGDSVADLARNIRDGTLAAQGRPDRSVPAWLHRSVLRGLATDPDDRWPAMQQLLEALVEDRRRRRRRLTWAIAAIPVLSIGVASAVVALRPEPSPAAIDATKQAVLDAREAAAAGYYVYPPPQEPGRPTAYTQVLGLEAMQGPIASRAEEAAEGLRAEMAQALVGLGDRYYEQPGGPPFAADFYANALIFDPDHARAKERSLVTPGQLAALQSTAADASFSESELHAGEVLTVLADGNPGRRAARASRLRASPRLPQSARERFERIVEAEAASVRPAASTVKASSKTPAPAAPDPAPDVGDREPGPREPGPGQSEDSATLESKPDSNGRPARPHPAKAKAEVSAGRAAMREGRFGRAAQHFHSALGHDRRSIAALEGLTDVAFERGEYGEAAKFGARAVQRSPRSGRLHIKLGDAYFKQLLYGKARASYETAESLGSEQAKGRLNRLDRVTG